MSTKIQWTRGDDGTPGETWNPAVGCTHISPGCDHCYAASVASRQMQPAHAGLTVGRKWNDTVRLLPGRLDDPLRWRRPRRVFVGSMTDLFHQDVGSSFLAEVFAVMALAERHTFQVLTKRPQRMARLLSNDAFLDDVDNARLRRDSLSFRLCDHPRPNVWLGTSIESQSYAWRERQLVETPAAVRFLSLEPLLGPVMLDLAAIDWVIVGCESGPRRRECCDSWVRGIRDQCIDAGVPLFVKQLQAQGRARRRVLHDLDEFPSDLRIREYPS